jgi:hypothetical protein
MHNNNALTYGDGQYGTPSFKNAADNLSRKADSKPDGLKYGDAIVKCVLLDGFHNFLIFDQTMAEKVYGANWDILSQIERILGNNQQAKRELEYFIRPYLGPNLYNPDKDPNHRTTNVIYNMFKDKDGFKKWTNFFREHGIRGSVYHGHGDGFCFVCYNFSEVIPYEVTFDRGQTWHKDQFDWERVKERMQYNNDVVQKVGHLYKHVSVFSKKVICNGKIFGLTNVETKNGKFNFVFNDTGKKISPIDFDEEPIVNEENGELEFVCHGQTFYGTVSLEGYGIPAFWSQQYGTWYPFENLNDVES